MKSTHCSISIVGHFSRLNKKHSYNTSQSQDETTISMPMIISVFFINCSRIQVYEVTPTGDKQKIKRNIFCCFYGSLC